MKELRESYVVMEVPLGELTHAELEEYHKAENVEVQFFQDVVFVIIGQRR